MCSYGSWLQPIQHVHVYNCPSCIFSSDLSRAPLLSSHKDLIYTLSV